MSASTPARHDWRRCALGALLPAAIVVALVALRFDAGPRQFLPVWNDEVIYWNETAVFAAAGFDGGYVTLHEFPAPVEGSRFGPHGPAFAVFHGAIARVTGMRAYTAFLINLAVVTLAAFAWLRGSRAGASPAALVLMATFWPLLLYLPTNMQEPTHVAFACLFALAIERHAAGTTWRTTTWTGLLLAAAALMRPSWILLLLPLGWRRARRHGAAGIAALVLVTLLGSAAASRAFDMLASPSRISVHVLESTMAEDPLGVPLLVFENAARNAGAWFGLTEDRPPEVLFRYATIAILALLAARAVRARRNGAGVVEAEAAVLALAPAVAVVLAFGDVESWRDFRVLAPHVLVALLLQLPVSAPDIPSSPRSSSVLRWAPLANRFGAAGAAWLVTLLFAPLLYREFVTFHEARFTTDPQPIAAMRAVTTPLMPFRPGASPWENSIAVPAELLQFPLAGLPPGVGISYVTDWQDMAREIKSAHLLLRPQDRDELAGRVVLTPVAETPLGTLYRNTQPVAGSP